MRGISLFDYVPSSIYSCQWKRPISLCPRFRRGLRWIVGNGSKISFWHDNWIFQYLIISICSPVVGSENIKVSDVINEYNQWDISQLTNLVSFDIKQVILSIFLPNSNREDSLV